MMDGENVLGDNLVEWKHIDDLHLCDRLNYKLKGEDGFPEFLKTRSKPRLVAYVPIEVKTVPSLQQKTESHVRKTEREKETEDKDEQKDLYNDENNECDIEDEGENEEELAEDGRKRCELPPLESELTFSRSPRRNISLLHGFSDEVKCKKISFEVDKKVVNHLRRKLTKRIERRLVDMFNGGHDNSDDEMFTADGKKRANSLRKSADPKTAMFSSYSEIGEKLKEEKRNKVVNGSLSKGGLEPLTNGHTGAEDTPEQPGRTSRPSEGSGRSRTFTSTTPLPDIPKGEDGRRSVTFSEKVQHMTLSDDSEDNDDDLPPSNQVSAGNELVVDDKSDVNFRRMQTSPIPTPVVHRPETRDSIRFSLEDRRSQILHGYVHRECPPDNKIIKLYLCSGFSDSEVERTSLMEHVWPVLRDFCKEHGRELQILDLHWGLKDAMSDDHQVPNACFRYIEECRRNDMGINVLIFLDEKYGESVVPSQIPKYEFEAILSSATEFRERQSAAIKSKMAEIEVTRQERDHHRLIEFDTPSSGPSPIGERSRESESGFQEEDIMDEDLLFARRTSIIKAEGLVMKALKEEEDELPDTDSLKQWYVLDENTLPPMYRLQKISTVFKDISKNDGVRYQAARANWRATAGRLRKVIQDFSEGVISEEARERFMSSLLEHELDLILGDVDYDSPNAPLCYKRTLLGLQNHLADVRVGEYIDVHPKHSDSIDTRTKSRMTYLREDLVPSKVNECNLHQFELSWISGGIAATTNREHINYLERMCKVTHDTLKRHLAGMFGDEGDTTPERKKLYDEVSQHVIAAQQRVKRFHGRKDVLQLIKSYLRSETNTPLVVHGKTGCGKSAILAKTAKDANKWIKEKDIRVVVRSVGVTFRSTNVRTLLRDLCLQLCDIYEGNYDDVPTEYKGLVNDFAYRISQASPDIPLVIILDGLDRLLDDHDGRKMSWLPKELPSNVHLIVSTLPDDRFECFQSMQKALNGKDDCFLEIGVLPTADALAIMDYWLNEGNRNLKHEQMDVLMEAFSKVQTPLFLKLSYKESLSWTSYTPTEHVKIQETVKKIATIKFGRLEKDHGDAFVRRALGYITAARNGITHNEMEDVLSLDDAVMDEVASHYSLSRRRLPSILWARLKLDLSDYLAECSADNIKTLYWSHVHFAEAADDRYLQQRDKAPSYHKALAEYFMGTWYEKPKPYGSNERGALRLVAKQDLYYEDEDALHDGSERVYNLRKINGLPYHLLKSQQMDLLKSEALCNFEWVLAKLCGTSLRSLLEEYSTVLQVEPSDPDLKTLSDTLHLSGVALQKEPRQLASQMIGRLTDIIARDMPRCAGDPKKYPYLHTFVAQAQTSSLPSLIPSVSCLTEPGGTLFDLLSGHTESITALTLTSDGMRAVTTSEDLTMKLWDIRTGRVVKTVEGVNGNVSSIRLAMNNTLAITTAGNIIKIWSLRSGLCLHEINEYVDPANITVATEGRVLVALFDGSNMFRSFDLDSYKLLCEKEIPDDSVHKDNSLVVADVCVGDHVLHAFRASNRATVQHARSGRIYHNLKCHDKSSSVVGLGFARDYYVLACRQQYMELHEIHQLELFDFKKGFYLRSVRGCVRDNIQEMYINMIGSHAIAICASESSNTSDIALWNLETEDHKHLARHPGVSTMGACLDFRFCLTAAQGDKTLRIWNISGKINQPAPKLKKSLGVVEIVPMQDNQRYVVARTLNNGPISVWNVAKAKCLQTAVRIERGLSETSDVVIVRNSFLVILTDRGFSNVSDDAKPVFQTILRYNLKEKRYDRKLSGCYIVPAPSHEYVLLDEDHLMGPSDNRTHFMIWSLVTGHVLHRIKTNFKDMERRKILERGISMVDVPKVKRGTTAKMNPWDRRAETDSAKKRRHEAEVNEERQRLEELKKEKENGIEQFIISGDEKIIVASFFAHHLCVFDIPNKEHTQTLENENSMMFLHVSALTHDGSHLVHANYDEESKISYVTLWDCVSGQVKRRLKKETNVVAIGITNDAEKVIIGKGLNELHVWEPMKYNSLRKVKGYSGLKFGVGSKIFTCSDGHRAVVFAGDISVWDIETATVLAVFTPDTRITTCNVALGGQLILFGLYEKSDVIILKLMSRDYQSQLEELEGEDMFGEKPDTSDEEDEEEEEK